MIRILICLTVLTVTTAGFSNPVNLDKASQTAIKFMSQMSGNTNPKIEEVTSFSRNGILTHYIVTFDPSGFVIVSADDASTPVLGYSVDGKIDPRHLPVNMLVWVDNIQNEIMQRSISGNVHPYWMKENFEMARKSEVLPMLTTIWDQGCYYNEMCPADTLGQCDHVAVGCVATAMGMIMKYWNYPQWGKGTHTYTTAYYGILSVDFGATQYDWSSMVDSLAGPNPAVATLLYHCGVAASMGYGSTTSGTGINSEPFESHFRYSPNAVYISSSQYDSISWVNVMRNELDNGRPILYAGFAPPPGQFFGHAWVVDGYDNTGLFHFNWGQSGWGNGYFILENSAFSYNNQAVIEIQPSVPCDVKASELIGPISETFTQPEPITVRFTNYDTVAVSDIPVGCLIDGITLISDTIYGSVQPLSDTTIVLNTTFDFSSIPGHTWELKLFTALPCDGYHQNDTITAFVENVACSNIPWTYGFESSEPFTGWKFVDDDNDGNEWGLGSYGAATGLGYMGAGANSNGADDWFITKCISLETGKLYRLKFSYKAWMPFMQNNFSVWMGSSQEMMDTMLFDVQDYSDTTYTQSSSYFAVTASGSYYFGWYCYNDPDMSILMIDDIEITEIIGTDATITEWNGPFESCDLGQENIMLTLRNLSPSPISNIPVAYSVDGNPVVQDTVYQTLMPAQSLVFTFSDPADFSAADTFSVKAFVHYPGDISAENDTLNYELINHISGQAPFSMGFESSENVAEWQILDGNTDGYTWESINYQTHSGSGAFRYEYSSWDPASDWLISNCIYLVAPDEVVVSFWSKIEDAAWPENLEVYMGYSPDTLSMWQIGSFHNLTNSAYQQFSIIEPIPVTGNYYFAWKCVSDALMFYLYLDDINIEYYPFQIEAIKPIDNFSLFPVPAKDLVYLTENGNIPANKTIEICTPEGKVVMTLEADDSKTTIDVSGFAPGMYILKVKTETQVSVLRFVKL